MASFTSSFLSTRQIALAALLAVSLGGSGAAAQSEPAEFTADPNVGPGGTLFTDSPHFRVYGVSASDAAPVIGELEAAYDCFIGTLGWRSSGLPYNTDSTANYYKTNVYGVDSLSGNAAGVMSSDYASGMGYLSVLKPSLAQPEVTVHEYGHVMTYHAKTWVDQTNTGAWWETVAQFVADTYLTSPLCATARKENNQTDGRTIIDLQETIGQSQKIIVDSTNLYQAWPFLSYLTYNPDNYTGLGTNVVRDLFSKYQANSDETPLHTLSRVATANSVQDVVGRYWARMAYLDIGHAGAKELFFNARSTLSYSNLASTGTGTYKVIAARQPQYMGSNIIPLKGTGSITAKVAASKPFTATLAIMAADKTVRYVALVDGSAQTTVASGEEASLVVVNTPSTLYNYDGFATSADVTAGLDYTVTLTGATA